MVMPLCDKNREDLVLFHLALRVSVCCGGKAESHNSWWPECVVEASAVPAWTLKQGVRQEVS